jgi:UTP--glucose-1-phosphate uridylyltransferase
MSFDPIRDRIRERMNARGIHPAATEELLRRAALVHQGFTGKIRWSEISAPAHEDLVALESIHEEARDEDLGRLVVIKLNGGLGTSMGLSKAKTLIPIKDGTTFLGLIRQQIEKQRARYRAHVPLLFMNSLATHEDTMREPGIASINDGVPGNLPVAFLQNWVPRLRADTLMPFDAKDPEEGWCPPGHGDIYLSLQTTGILEKLLANGFRVAFISNGDNLGASVDGRILSWFLSQGLDFAMEVTPKTAADLKGGALFRHRPAKGPERLGLLEIAQVENGHEPDFQDTRRFSSFNTNNLWVNLESLRDRLARGLELPVIVNPKTVEGTKVLQLETAMGSAIGSFERTRGLVVPRTRFAPVKTNADLLVRRSDCYVVREDDGTLVRNPARKLGEPTVTLDASYKRLDDFEALFPSIPSLVDAESLVVEGKVRFDRPVRLCGKVVFRHAGDGITSLSSLGRDRFADETVTL